MNRYDAEDALDLIDTLLPFANNSEIQIPLKQLSIELGKKSEKFRLLSLLNSKGVIQMEVSTRETTRVGFWVPLPASVNEEMLRIVINESELEECRNKYAKYLVIADYDTSTQTLKLFEEERELGRIKFNDSGSNAWLYALDRIGTRVHENDLKASGQARKGKTLNQRMSNHPKYKALKHITHFNQRGGFVIVHTKSLLDRAALEEIETVLNS